MKNKYRMKKNEGFKELPFKKKLEHIWEYYRTPILVGVFCLVFVLPFAITWLFGAKPVLDVMAINTTYSMYGYAPTDTMVEGFRPFLEDAGEEYYDNAISFSTSLYFNEIGEDTDEFTARLDYQGNMEQYNALFTNLASGETELFFGTGTYFQLCCDMGAMKDLSQILPSELLEKYQDRLLYSDNEGESPRYPCAVALPDCAWLELMGYDDGCNFGVNALSDNPQLAEKFAVYLLDTIIQE